MSSNEMTAEEAKQILESVWSMPDEEVKAMQAAAQRFLAARAVADGLCSPGDPMHANLTALAGLEAKDGLRMCPECHQRVSGMTKCPAVPWRYHVDLFE
jgi:hypothetical protein